MVPVLSCAVDGCQRPSRTKGFCNAHYMRWYTYGDPLAGGTMKGEPLAFYEATVVADTDECLRWPYGKDTDGYSRVWVDGKTRRLCVLTCERFHGPRERGMEGAHSCRNRDCYNPRHLSWKNRS